MRVNNSDENNVNILNINNDNEISFNLKNIDLYGTNYGIPVATHITKDENTNKEKTKCHCNCYLHQIYPHMI